MNQPKRKVLFIIAGLVPTGEENAAIMSKVEAGEDVTVESAHKINPNTPPAMEGYAEIVGAVPKPWQAAFDASRAPVAVTETPFKRKREQHPEAKEG